MRLLCRLLDVMVGEGATMLSSCARFFGILSENLNFSDIAAWSLGMWVVSQAVYF